MAKKLNSEFNYRTQVIGDTPWARLQTLLGFLEGRKRAKALEEINALRLQAKKEKVKYLQQNTGPLHEIYELQADIMEAESSKDDVYNAYRLNEQELDILNKLIAELRVECEKTRVEGYTDEQMFELNEANDFTAMILKDMYSEIIANGKPSATKIRNAMSNPVTWEAAKSLGFLPKEAKLLSFSEISNNLEFIGGFNESLKISKQDNTNDINSQLLNEALQDESMSTQQQ